MDVFFIHVFQGIDTRRSIPDQVHLPYQGNDPGVGKVQPQEEGHGQGHLSNHLTCLITSAGAVVTLVHGAAHP